MALIEVGKVNLSVQDRIEFFRSLSNWLTSGGGRMSVAEAVRFTCETFSRDEYSTLAPKMNHISREVTAGQITFHEALSVAKLGFTKQELAIVRAAEESSQLRQTMPSLVEAMETKARARKSLTRKLAMPLFAGVLLVLMSIGVMTIMMPSVLGPVLTRNASALNDMPFIIGWYWGASQWLQDFWVIPTATVFVFVVLIFIRNTPAIKPHFEKTMLKFGPIRRLIISYNAMLVVYFMPALLRSGMPPHDVLRTLAETLETLSIAGSLRVAANEYEGGTQLVDALVHLPFRSSFRSSVEAGEKTGAIADRVEDLKNPYAADLERIINQTVIGLTTLVMAILLPLFLLSMYITLTVPIFALMEF